MMLCYLREEIDAPPGDEIELMDKAIKAGEMVISYLDISFTSGNSDLGPCLSSPSILRIWSWEKKLTGMIRGLYFTEYLCLGIDCATEL